MYRNTDAEIVFVCVPITLFVLDTPGVSISAWEVIRRQAADLFSWESHPRAFFMARPRITEVSLSPASVIAASGSNPDFAYKFYRSPHIEGRGAPTHWLDLPVDAGNVPDEMDIQFSKIMRGLFFSDFLAPHLYTFWRHFRLPFLAQRSNIFLFFFERL